MKESILIAIIIILIYIYFIRNDVELMSVSIDGEKVLVRKTPDYKNSAKLLHELIKRMYILRDFLVKHKENYPEFTKYIKLLGNNFNKKRTTIYENNLRSSYTSYNVNKGEELVFCLRCKKSHNLHDINLLVYVAVHEMAHSGCPEIGHPPLFNKIFHFFLTESINLGIYKYENYNSYPVNYCGMNLNTNILN